MFRPISHAEYIKRIIKITTEPHSNKILPAQAIKWLCRVCRELGGLHRTAFEEGRIFAILQGGVRPVPRRRTTFSIIIKCLLSFLKIEYNTKTVLLIHTYPRKKIKSSLGVLITCVCTQTIKSSTLHDRSLKYYSLKSINDKLIRIPHYPNITGAVLIIYNLHKFIHIKRPHNPTTRRLLCD